MDCDEMEALRVLADFAESHAEEVYLEGIDDDEQLTEMRVNYEHLLEAVKTAQAYLDGDQNEAEDEALIA